MTISHVALNKPLQGTPDEQAVELYHLRRDLEAARTALRLRDEDTASIQEAEELVNLLTNKHRNTDGFILTPEDVALVINHIKAR